MTVPFRFKKLSQVHMSEVEDMLNKIGVIECIEITECYSTFYITFENEFSNKEYQDSLNQALKLLYSESFITY